MAKKISVIAIIVMILSLFLSLFKISINGESINLVSATFLVGIVTFFIIMKSEKESGNGAGLSIKIIPKTLKDKKIIFLILMPLIMNMICFLIAKIFVPKFAEHLAERTIFLSADKFLLLMIQLMVSAVGEEIAWRGFFQKQLLKVVPFVPTLIITSTLFSVCHYSQGTMIVVLIDLLFVFINATFYGIIFKKTDNVFISAIAHFFANLFGVILLYFL